MPAASALEERAEMERIGLLPDLRGHAFRDSRRASSCRRTLPNTRYPFCVSTTAVPYPIPLDTPVTTIAGVPASLSIVMRERYRRRGWEAKHALTCPAAGTKFLGVSVCQCESLEKVFDQREAAAQLERARRKGPRRTTRLLIESLRSSGVAGKTLLDIGGGVGVIQQELLKAGLHAAIGVDASSAYVRVAEGEMRRLGFIEKVRYYHGNFVDVAPTVPPADMVTMDRVICCYDDLEALLTAAAGRTRSTCALVFPRDAWWMRLVGSILNAIQWLRRDSYRFFVHAASTVEDVMGREGLTRVSRRPVGLWQVVVYAR